MRRPLPAERLADLADPTRGLPSTAVEAHRLRWGANAIVEEHETSWWAIVRETTRDPMIWFLIGTAGLFAVLGDVAETAVLLLAIVPLVGMDAFLHRRTQASTAGLQTRIAASARLVRDGVVSERPATDVVVGDVALIAAGELFPADGIVIGGEAVQVDESALTGEAFPVRKRPLGADALRTDDGTIAAAHWGLAGTRVLTGDARLLVAYTGAETLYGEIVRAARTEGDARTPLQEAIARLVRMLLLAALAICVVLAGIRLRQGFGAIDALLSAVTLAVAALPEEFPVVFTVFLGVGVYRLARRQALVRRGVVVENIGRVSCICSDKTGTLTEGRLQLAHLVPADGVADAALLASAATASRREGGDPLDVAILDTPGAPAAEERLATFPFTEDRRRETAVVGHAGGVRVAVKGAPETVLGLCTLDAASRAAWQARVRELAAGGHKVIACAARELPVWDGREPTGELSLLGLLAFEDPVRDGVVDAVARCRAAGIRVVMVTGDHPLTAAAIAAEVGLGGGTPRVVEAAAIDAGTGALAEVDVVARAMPGHKLALVRRLQAAGDLVAVTGDGVNDVPALQAADVGIAMGERGTRSAREAAAMVLLDDNFRTIVGAVAEGRQLFRNLQRSFAYLLMLHTPLVLTALLIPVAGFPLLYLPIHVVWYELIVHPTALLAFQDAAPPGLDGRLVHGTRHTRFFTRRQWAVIVGTGVAVTIAVLAGYLHNLDGAQDVPHARAMALVLLLVAGATMTVGLTRLRTAAARWITLVSLAVTLVAVQVPALAARLHVAPLHPVDLALAFLLGIASAAPSALFERLARRAPAPPPAERMRDAA